MMFEPNVLAAILSGGTPQLRDWRSLPVSMLTRGERNCRFIESFCKVPEGEHVGKPVVLADFQVAFILAIYDNPNGTDTGILSIARKNAKTGTIAFILLIHLVGPEAKQNSRIVSGAMSRDQAAEVYNLASKCVMLSEKLSSIIKIIPSGKKLIGLPLSVEYQAISAEGKTAHGKSPILAILDEVGQISGPQSDFVDAITTAQGAYDNPLLIYISTQAANDADLFSVLIDDSRNNKPPKTVCHVYAADQEADPLDESGWYKANPALGLFRSLTDMRKQAEKAARMPSFENTFRNLNLNQRVSVVSPFVSRSVWMENIGQIIGDGDIWYGGLDLSARTDLTAFTLISENSEGKIDVEQYFWTPEVGLLDRQKVDRQPYGVWVKQGFLRTTPGATVDYEFVAQEISEIIGARHVEKLAFDRWRIDVFKSACTRLGINLPLVPFGQGYKDMSPAIDAFEALLLNSKINHGAHPVLTMCAANAVITKDPADNRKLDKHKATGRVDGMVSLTMAIGVLNSEAEEQEPPSPWEDESYSIAG
jgi:phage terminase large subunit-like protein